jgi:RHS repeat-associated protein
VSDAGVSEHMEYYPFGSVRSGHVSTDRGFTGQRREGFSRLGAYFYHARFYATGLGHFLSADTSAADGLDRYAYVRFNPLRYSDPSGHGVSNSDGTSCPPTRPDCEIDGGPPPTGGDGGGCDENCQILHALADGCAANPGQGYCAGSGSSGSPNGGAAPPVASPLPVACGGPCPTAPTDTPSDGCWLCDVAGAAARRAPKVAAGAACLTSMFCPAVATVIVNRAALWNGLTSNCVRGVTKVTFVASVLGGSAAVVVATGGSALAAGYGVPAAAGAAGAVGISEGVNLAPQANRLWSNFQSGSQDVIDGCL